MRSPSATDELLRYILPGETAGGDLARWLAAVPRFAAFVAANREKVRKKLRNARDRDGYLDVEAELSVACRLVQDRRVALVFEPHGAGGGPDFAVTFRAGTVFNVEATRLRRASAADAPPAAALRHKVAGTVCAKLRQLPPGVPNVLALVLHDRQNDGPAAGAAAGTAVAPASVAAEGVAAEGFAAEDVAGAIKHLKAHAQQRDDAYFLQRGMAGARDFHRRYARLSAVVALGVPATTALWSNNETRHPLPADACTMLRRLEPLPA